MRVSTYQRAKASAPSSEFSLAADGMGGRLAASSEGELPPSEGEGLPPSEGDGAALPEPEGAGLDGLGEVPASEGEADGLGSSLSSASVGSVEGEPEGLVSPAGPEELGKGGSCASSVQAANVREPARAAVRSICRVVFIRASKGSTSLLLLHHGTTPGPGERFVHRIWVKT